MKKISTIFLQGKAADFLKDEKSQGKRIAIKGNSKF